MTVTVLPEVMQDMAESAYRQQVYIVAETQMHVAPWLFEDEGWDKSRLKAAIELVCTGKVTQTAEGWHVEGASREGYDLPGATLACPCKAAAHNRKTSVCKHRVAVELARRVQQAYPQDTPLPFGPVTVDERLAAAAHDAQARARALDALPLIAHREEGPVYTTSEGVPYTLDESTHVRTPHTPQEDRMADDDAKYIPEPDDAPVATLEAPTPVPALRPRAPQVDDLEAALQVWTTERAVVQRFLKQELKANIDYYTLRIGGKDSKPSLSKAGAEKVLGWLKLQASFTPDTGTWEMLGRPQDLVCYVCTIRTRSGEIVGEGRGARSLKKDGGDVNKAIKMAEKSACVSAVLRTGALSDVFTCDLEDMQEEPAKITMPSAAMRTRIWELVQKMAPDVKTREEVERFIQDRTGCQLLPNQYAAILTALEQGR